MQGEDLEEVLAAKAMTMGLVESPRDFPKDLAVMRVVETMVAKPMGSPIYVQLSSLRSGAASARAGTPGLRPTNWS